MKTNALGRFVKRPLSERLTEYLSKITLTEQGCWEWAGALTGSGKGYPVMRNDAGKRVRVGRLMLERSGKPRPSEKYLACHICDNTACVNPEHLFWGTTSQNAIDASRKGRSYKPTPEHLSKLKAAVKAKWKDPTFRVKHREASLAVTKTDAFKLAVKGGIYLSITHNQMHRKKDM